MNMFELLKINLIFLASSIIVLAFLLDSYGESKHGRALRRLSIGGFVVFQAARWLPFAIVLLGRPLVG